MGLTGKKDRQKRMGCARRFAPLLALLLLVLALGAGGVASQQFANGDSGEGAGAQATTSAATTEEDESGEEAASDDGDTDSSTSGSASGGETSGDAGDGEASGGASDSSADNATTPASSAGSITSATLDYVIDGDTIIVRIDGERAKVRLAGIDAAESVNPDESKNTERGQEESDHLKGLLAEGQQLWLEQDVSDHDKYGRLVRYVWLECPENPDDEGEARAKMLNAQLVAGGWADAYRYWPDVKWYSLFEELAEEAQQTG